MSTTLSRPGDRVRRSATSARITPDRIRAGTRILVVDDEPDLVELLRTYLLMSECDVSTATNGVDALTAIARQRPDVVLLDIHMPRMNGLEALKEIMKIDSSIGVLMITGNTQLPITVEAIRHGAFAYIPKPFDFRYLDHLIAATLSRCSPGR